MRDSNLHPSRRHDRPTMHLRRLSDGLVVERDPATSKELVYGEGFVFVDHTEPSVRDRLEALSATDLARLMAQVGRRQSGDPRDFCIDYLVPQVECGAVSLEAA